jgi:hypothetical protein
MVGDRAATALAGINVVPPAVVETAIGAAVTGIKGMAASTGRRARAVAFAGAIQAIAASVAVPGNEVVAVGIPGAVAVGRGNNRAISLPE